MFKALLLVGFVIAAQLASAGSLTIEVSGKQTRIKDRIFFQVVNAERAGNKPVLTVNGTDSNGMRRTCEVSADMARSVDTTLGQLADFLASKNGGLLCQLDQESTFATGIILYYYDVL